MTQKPTYKELELRINELEKKLNQTVEGDPKGPRGLFEAIFESLTDAIFILDAEIPPRIINCNPVASKIFGYTREEIIGRTTDFLHVGSTELKKFQQQLYPSIAEGGYFHLSDFCMKRKDETVFPTEHTVAPLLTKERQRIGWVSIVRDITNQKLVEKALRESEERFRTAFQTIPDPVTIIRLDNGRCVDINDGFTSTTGWTREEVIGKTASDLKIWHNPKDREKFIAGISKDGQIRNLDAKFRVKNNELMWGLFSAKLLTLDGENHILSITRDISELKKAQNEKEELETQLRQSQKMEAIGTLIGGIAHDFNNILATIMGYSEIVMSDLSSESTARENLQQVLNATHRGKNLIKHILVFSRRSEQELMPIRLHLIVKETIALFRASLPANIEIHQNIVEESDMILADPNQIRQVLLNLCSNAYHAMLENGGKISIMLMPVELDAKQAAVYPGIKPGFYSKLTVSDTGQGMDSDTLDRIFDPYFTTKSRDKGTGLGLAVVHGIIKNHDGLISVVSEIGKGSRFEILIPRIDQESQAELLKNK